MECFPDQPIDAPVNQQIRMPPVARPRHDLQLRKIPFGDFDHPQRIFRMVQRDDQQFRLLRPGRTQQIGAGRVAVIDLVAEPADVSVGDEHDEHEWLTIDEALARYGFPGERASLREIVELLSTLARERDLGILFITHNLPLVRSIASEVIVLQAGQIVEQGPTEAVFTAPQQQYTRNLLRNTPTLHGAFSEAGR